MQPFAFSPPFQRGRRQSKLLVVAGVVLALLFSLVGTADAQTDRVRTRQLDRVDQVDRVQPVPQVETLRLSCTADSVNGQRGVLCQWSEATNPRTRAYQLYRITNGSARQLITTVGADGRLGYFDTHVTAPSSLVYGVISINRNGRLIGQSPAVHVQYGHDIEQLRMACAPDFIDGERGVLCRWSESSHPNVRAYLVYRSTNNHDQRELVARIGLDGRTAYFDTNVRPGVTLAYGVTAVDGDGTVVAVGGPQRVTWPDAG